MSAPTRPRPPLTADLLGPDPLEAFRRWFEEAETRSGMINPNAVTLATAGPDGAPDARVVLLKGVDRRGFLFFTNYHSAKGKALERNPRGALAFYWDALGRQVRVRGRVILLPRGRVGAGSGHGRPNRVGRPGTEPGSSVATVRRRPAFAIGTSRVRTTGEDTCCVRTRSSSGKTERTGSTTASSSCAKARSGGWYG